MGQRDTSDTANSWMCSARLLAINPRTLQLDTADWVHLLQAKYTKDETLSAVEMANVLVVTTSNSYLCLR